MCELYHCVIESSKHKFLFSSKAVSLRLDQMASRSIGGSFCEDFLMMINRKLTSSHNRIKTRNKQKQSGLKTHKWDAGARKTRTEKRRTRKLCE